MWQIWKNFPGILFKNELTNWLGYFKFKKKKKIHADIYYFYPILFKAQ